MNSATVLLIKYLLAIILIAGKFVGENFGGIYGGQSLHLPFTVCQSVPNCQISICCISNFGPNFKNKFPPIFLGIIIQV